MMAAAAAQAPPDRSFFLGLAPTPSGSRRPSLSGPPSPRPAPAPESATLARDGPLVMRGRPRQPTFPRYPSPSAELTTEIQARVGGLDLARGRQRQPPPVAPPAPASASSAEPDHKVWPSGAAPGDLPEPSPESPRRIAESPRASPRSSPRASARDRTKRSKNKIVSISARGSPADRESVASPGTFRSRQSSARSPWKRGSNGAGGASELFRLTPEPYQVECVKTRDDKDHLDPIAVDVRDAGSQDAHPAESERCAGRKVTFDGEVTGRVIATGGVDVGAAEPHLKRLEEMIEQRMDALDRKLDGVLHAVSASVAAARQRQHHRPQIFGNDYSRKHVSGWGESSLFGLSHAPVFDAGAPRTTGTGSASLNVPGGGFHEQGRACAGGGERLEGGSLQDLMQEEPVLSGNPSMFDNGVGSRSVAAGFGRQYSPGGASDLSKQSAGGSGRTAQTPGKSEQRQRSKSQGSDNTYKSAASGASRLSARGVDKRSKFAQKVWVFLEDPESSNLAKCHHRIYMLLVFVSAILPPIETLPDPPISQMAYYKLSAVIETVFLVELLLKWYASPNKRGFVTRFYNLLDFAIIPIIILRSVEYYVFSDHGTHHDPLADLVCQKILLCVVPVMRLIKALRGQQNFALLTHTLTNVLEPLCVPLFMLMMVCLVFSCSLYVVEPRDNIVSVPEAMWLVILTVSTVGYGDIFPRTDVGRLFTSALVFLGCLCMAMPIGIVGTAFTETWRNRARILAMKRIRDRLNQWGYDDDDLRVLFRTYDKNQSGVLDVLEFVQCIRSLKLGFDEGQIKSLFMVLDANGSGSLDMEEFVHLMGLKKSGFQFGVF